jgi:cytochrome c-type biogenesis protein CcmE
MAQPSWTADSSTIFDEARPNRLKFVVVGGVILAAIIFLIVQAVSNEGQFFVTVGEYYANPAKYEGRDFRVSAWVDGETIKFTQVDAYNSRLEFDIVDNLANPANRMRIVALNEPLPDLLQHEAQAIVEGRVGSDGAMYANPDGVLLKCPTRYEAGAAN